jgi:hypothetical protein
MNFYLELHESQVAYPKPQMADEIFQKISPRLQIEKPKIIWFKRASYGEDVSFVRSKAIFGAANPNGTILIKADESLEQIAETITHELFHISQFRHETAKYPNGESEALKFGKSPVIFDIVQKYTRWQRYADNLQINFVSGS